MSRTLTPKEKRTVRMAAGGVCIYLVLFYGPALVSFLSTRRAAYNELLAQEQELRNLVKPYESKAETVSNLMDHFRMDPAKLQHNTIMAGASAAIQMAAASEGVGVGPLRETAGRASAKEAGSIQFEGTGQIPSVMAFLHHLDRVGFPVIVDSIQFSQAPGGQNRIKITMTMVVLDYDDWKAKEDQSHA